MKRIIFVIGMFLAAFNSFSQKAELVLPIGHIDKITSICFSPDGKFLLTGSNDKTAKLWDVITGKEIRTFKSHTNAVTSVCFSADGKFVFTSSKDSTARCWDVLSGKEKYRYLVKNSVVNGVAVSQDKKQVVTGGDDKTIRIWATEAEKETKSFTASDKINSISLSKDGKHIAVGLNNFSIEIYSLSGSLEMTLKEHTAKVNSVIFSSDNKYILSASDDKSAILWDAKSGKKIKTFSGHTDKVLSANISSNSSFITTGSADKTCKVWDITGTVKNTFSNFTNEVTAVCFSPNSSSLATGSLIKNSIAYQEEEGGSTDIIYNGIGYVKTWNLSTGKEVNKFCGHSAWVNGVAVSKDGTLLLVGSYDKTAKLWSLSEGKQIQLFTGHTDLVTSVAISPDNKYVLTGSADNSAILWDAKTGKRLKTFTDKNFITSVAFNNDATNILTSAAFESVKIWDVKTGKVNKSLDVGKNGSLSACYSPDNKNIVVGGVAPDFLAYLFNAATGEKIRVYKGHKNDINSVAFSPDGKSILTGSYDNTIKLWDTKSDAEKMTLKGHAGWVYSVKFSNDGSMALSSSADNTARLWSINSGSCIKTFIGHEKEIESVAFGPKDKTIVTGSNDNTTKIWDITTGNEIATLICIDSTDFVVTNPQNMFDASSGAMNLMHYAAGMEPIELGQLKDRYYDPGLLAKLLGYKEEKVRTVEGFSDVKLYPDVKLEQSKTNKDNLNIDLTNQGGGIGKVVVYINGKEIAQDARGASPDPNAKTMKLNVPIKNHPYLKPGGENIIEVKAYNSEGYLTSRGVQMIYNADNATMAEPPRIFIVTSGVSDYTGDKIDLKFAAKDAEDMMKALSIGAKRLFGEDKTFTYLLTTNQSDPTKKPTKANIVKTFEDIAKVAKSSDIIIVYISGHGINWGGQDGDFFYLTQDAYTGALEAYGDPAIRKSCTISSTELTEMIKKVPALKQVLIIDACASGKMVENLIAKRDISSSTLRALDRMKDRTGMHIITGCTADAVSYEASKFGQGLLTYSILEGIKGFSLRDNAFVDVSTLFQHARDRVPELAAGIGGIQKPEVFSPYGAESFDIGEVLADDKKNIPIAQSKPMVSMTSLQDEKSMDDILGLEKKVDDAFRNNSANDKTSTYVFLEAKDFPDAYRLRGQYNVVGSQIKIKINVFKGKDKVSTFEISENKDDLDKIVQAIVKKAEEQIK